MRRFCTRSINVDPVATLKRRFSVRSGMPERRTASATGSGSR